MNQINRISLICALSLCLGGCQKQTKADKELQANRFLEQATLAAQEHRYNEAIQAINKSLALKESPQVLALKATWLYRIGNTDASLELFEKILNSPSLSSSLRADTKNNYACVLNQHNEKKKAEQLWQELTKDMDYLTPEVAYFNLGLLAISQKNFMKAIDKFNHAITLTPDYVDAYYYLAIAYFYTRDFEHAHESLERVLSLANQHKAAQALLKKVKEALQQELIEDEED